MISVMGLAAAMGKAEHAPFYTSPRSEITIPPVRAFQTVKILKPG